MKKKWIWIAPLAIIALAGFIALGGEVVRLLWNWLLPPLFGFHQVTFWQALGLLVLCRLLVGGLSHGGGGSGSSKFRRRVEDRWERMSPEERARFRKGMCGPGNAGPAANESPAQ